MASGKLLQDGASFNTKFAGSLGWQAPEILRGERLTNSVDIFSLGCTFYFCLSGGNHPFGARVERDINIIQARPNLLGVTIEARDLISKMINND